MKRIGKLNQPKGVTLSLACAGTLRAASVLLIAVSIGLFSAQSGRAQTLAAPASNNVVAIGIVLVPDATMTARAQAANERLRQNYPDGFALDETHRPHIACLQRYVATNNLENVYAAVSEVLKGEKPTAWKLNAYKYNYIPWTDLGLAGIVIRPSEDLLRFQQKLIDAVEPYSEKMGTATAFVTTPEEPDINQLTLNFVRDYVTIESIKEITPHVTVGLARQDYLRGMIAEKFGEFTFSPTGVAVYQLGNFGTARKRLISWEAKR
jgi:hypothetical protein